MSPEQHKRVEELFLRVGERPEPERRAMLDALNEDTAVLAEVRSLLGHHSGDPSFLDSAELLAMSLGLGAGAKADEPTLAPGTRVGDFTIKSALGSGGMGIVYIAEQERPRRTVALKVIRRGFGTSGLVRRFEHEAEVLGRLQHPGIAQIFEAGTADLSTAGGLTGQPFIAMELVKGPPLNIYADTHKLGTRERLGVIVRVCEAVQHAHQRGVIHRDLKPANILVDEHGQPKVLDFGVARITDGDLHITTFRTSVGQLIGTLPYMSPEQVLADPREVDTRSDVYAIGVVLYQLLTGRLPYDLSSRSIPEAARVIRDEAPAKLSAISRVFRGEIETIVAKALAKDKARRYQSAADLGQDIQRHLDGRPIAAKDDSALYLLRKQLNRHRGAVAAALFFLVGLIAFAAYASIQAERRGRLAEHNRELAIKARQAGDLLASELSVSNIERGRLHGYLGSMRLAEDQLWPELVRSPDSAHARWALWELYMQLPCLCTLTDPQGKPNDHDLNPDHTLLVSGSAGGVVRVWDLLTNRQRLEFSTGEKYWPAVRFVPGGNLVATAGARGLEFWDTSAAPPMRKSIATGFVARGLAAAEDGTILVGGEDGSLRLVRPGAEPETLLPPGKAAIRNTELTPDAHLAGWTTTAGEFWTMSLQPRGEPKLIFHTSGSAFGASFSRDGRLAAAGSGDRAARVWNLQTGECIRKIQFGSDGFHSVAISPDGEQVTTGNWWGVEVWRISDGVRLRALTAHRGETDQVRYSRDGTLLVSTGVDRCLRIWEMQAASARQALRAPGGPATGLAVAPGGQRTAISGKNGAIQIIDAASGKPPQELPGDGKEVGALQFNAAGDLLAAGTADGAVQLWDLKTGLRRFSIPAHKGETYAVVFVDGERKLASGARDGRIFLWDAGTGAAAGTLERASADPRVVGQILRNPAGDRIVSLPSGREVPELDLSGRTTGSYSVDSSSWTGAWSGDGSRIAIGGWSGNVEVFDTRTRARVSVYRGLDRLVTAVAYSPDGALLAAASTAGETKMWDVATERILVTFPPARPGPHTVALAFRAEDALLAASDVGEASSWDLRYYDRHIAGNLEYQLQNLDAPDAAKAALRDWAQTVFKH